MPKSFEPSIQMIAGGFIAVGAFVFFGWGIPGLITASQSYSWPVSIAIIQECRVTERKNKDDVIVYTLRFVADFEVDGVSYTTQQRYLDGEIGSSFPKRMHAFVAKHPVGSSIPIYYDLSDPQKTTIKRGLGWRYMVIPLVGILFMLTGVFFWEKSTGPIGRFFQQMKNLFKNYSS